VAVFTGIPGTDGMGAMVVQVPWASASEADVNARREVIIVASIVANRVFIF